MEYAEKLGLTESFECDGIPVKAGTVGLEDADAGDLAWAGIGQYTDLVTPYSMLRLCAAIANGGTGYRFNTDGNQVTYRCDVRRVTTINYDRNVIRAELGRLDRAADEMSAKLDICMVTSSVDYTPPFDVNSGFADAFENYLENRR